MNQVLLTAVKSARKLLARYRATGDGTTFSTYSNFDSIGDKS
jgi:hypothetical protein